MSQMLSIEDLQKKKLNSSWIVWRHDANNTNWKADTLEEIFEIKTIYDFWLFFNNISLINFKDNIF